MNLTMTLQKAADDLAVVEEALFAIAVSVPCFLPSGAPMSFEEIKEIRKKISERYNALHPKKRCNQTSKTGRPCRRPATYGSMCSFHAREAVRPL